jgi:hypothetical protein
MTAWEKARQWQLIYSTISLEERVAWHLAHGVVHSDSSCLVLASLVSWDSLAKAPGSPDIPPNAWFIELASLVDCPLYRISQVLPNPMQWIVFRRDNGLDFHAWSWDRMTRLAKHLQP